MVQNFTLNNFALKYKKPVPERHEMRQLLLSNPCYRFDNRIPYRSWSSEQMQDTLAYEKAVLPEHGRYHRKNAKLSQLLNKGLKILWAAK